MIDEQKRIYRDLMWEFKELSAKGKKVVTSKLMQLRQISNHPLLYRSRYTDDRVVKIAKVLCKKVLIYCCHQINRYLILRDFLSFPFNY